MLRSLYCSGRVMYSKWTSYTKESSATNSPQQGKSRKIQKMEYERMPSHYLAHGLGKMQPKIENSWGNEWRRLRLDLGYNAIQQRLTISVSFPFQTAALSLSVNAWQLRLQTLTKRTKQFKSQTFKDLKLLTSCKLGTPLLCAYFFVS
jgi:hypothetical protein